MSLASRPLPPDLALKPLSSGPCTQALVPLALMNVKVWGIVTGRDSEKQGSSVGCQSEVIRGKAQGAGGMGQGHRDQWTGRMGHMDRDSPTCGIEVRGIRDRG